MARLDNRPYLREMGSRLAFWAVALNVIGILVLVGGFVAGAALVLHKPTSLLALGVTTWVSAAITAVLLLALAEVAKALVELRER